ncbi:M28 family peptidase [Polymorphospora sp. NPDC051019]|uniref:M28 family peptidase n=1 Tax=Polymorphospora sp. NPDC051019 TaxID=3155725 RepID=UPI003447D162
MRRAEATGGFAEDPDEALAATTPARRTVPPHTDGVALFPDASGRTGEQPTDHGPLPPTNVPVSTANTVRALDLVLAQISARRMTTTVNCLADKRFAGRRAGTPGGAAARAWLAGQLAELGATVAVAPFDAPRVPEVYAAPQVRWNDGRALREPVFGRDVGLHLTSSDAPLIRRGELAVAGQGDPTGRWLVVPAAMSVFDAYGHAGRSCGLLLPGSTGIDGWLTTTLAGTDAGPLPMLALEPNLHAAVHGAAAQRRGWWSANAPIRRLDLTAANIHASFATARDADLEILLTAHFDGVGDVPGLRQPAASHAGGVAVVLEAARLLAAAPPPRTALRVALLDAEALGGRGAAHHAATLASDGARPLVISIDGAGLVRRAAHVGAGGDAHRLLATVDQAGRHVCLPLSPRPLISDDRRYAAAGLATVGIGAGMGGDHSPADTPDRVQPASLVALARLVVATVWLTARHAARFRRAA